MKPHRKTMAVFLDLSAVFDHVWRQKLVHICYNTGIKDNAFIWKDFLRDRKFSGIFNGLLSKSHKLRAGVSQGSVLSPLLFLIYMNAIHPDTKIAFYADDTAVWHSHIDTVVSEKVIKATFEDIAAWAEDLILTINADKTNFCSFSTNIRHRSTFSATMKIRESQIKRVDHSKYLSIILDPELRFSKHIENTASRVLQKLNIPRKLCGTS
ncbi:putative RNA-directed DNA polymerase from transposon BS [Nephila pilipes]|uniref:Putative RNA-directed DNA polymerase from transposon BS n=1 Tax=Nephila pilipes TaxID=299642 RepID=A0A8X6PIU9_NEPPI|nr:putative RNA-directed DNA polymerase from transposon BS [Nephila pilipes]